MFGNAALGFMSPKFDVNDVGFMSRADVVNGHAAAQGTETNSVTKYQDVIARSGSGDFQGNVVWAGVWGVVPPSSQQPLARIQIRLQPGHDE